MQHRVGMCVCAWYCVGGPCFCRRHRYHTVKKISVYQHGSFAASFPYFKESSVGWPGPQAPLAALRGSLGLDSCPA